DGSRAGGRGWGKPPPEHGALPHRRPVPTSSTLMTHAPTTCAKRITRTTPLHNGRIHVTTAVALPRAGGSGGRTAVAARARQLTKAYGNGETRVVALDAVDVDIARGQFTAIMGPSGSGKSTLMHCLAGLDTVTSGQIYLDDTEITGLKDKKLTQLRRDRIGFIFQAFNLLPTLNALENITLPRDIAGRKPDKQWLARVVDTVG